MAEEKKKKKCRGVYTNHAIYIDEHIKDIVVPYQNPEIENKVYQSIEAICYTLSYKYNYFQDRYEYYEPFSKFAAISFYNIFKDRYINQGKIKRGKEVRPIKSSLNFIKRVLKDFAVDYAKQFFNDVYNDTWGEEEENKVRKELETRRKAAVAHYVRSSVENDYNYKVVEAISNTCQHISSIIKKVVYNTPYKKDKLMVSRLYKSCLLSFINSITLPNEKAIKLKDSINTLSVLKQFNKEKANCVILWHLPEEMAPQIAILLVRIKEQFTKEIEGDVSFYSLDDNMIDDILASAYTTYDTDQSGDY